LRGVVVHRSLNSHSRMDKTQKTLSFKALFNCIDKKYTKNTRIEKKNFQGR